ncbi:MAG TPA: NADH-quinone oxidoreductase subunit J [Mycobacteriales bacterium]|nr:NADH-quinone oxidoreductase subunit J [Mycobacteriales bacterium]
MSAGLHAVALQAADAAVTHTRTGEAVTFYILAPIAVGAALGMIFAKNAVHAALLLVVDFFCLAAFYAVQDAPFLAAVQVIVYAGAIMILFLFVLMLVGVDSSDSLLETIRGQRLASGVLGLGFLGLLIGVLLDAIDKTRAVGLTQANSGGNVQGIAKTLFTSYVFPFEITSALLIVAAVGAMVLGHRELREPRPTQAELMRARLHGPHPEAFTGPGVYASDDAVDRPALLPSGMPAAGSVYEEYGGGSLPPGAVPPEGDGR